MFSQHRILTWGEGDMCEANQGKAPALGVQMQHEVAVWQGGVR